LDELLGVLTLASGTGYNESTIAQNLLELWKHTNKVQVALLGSDKTSVQIRCFNQWSMRFAAWKTRYSRSRAPVVGMPSSSDGIDFSQNIHIVWWFI